MKFFKTLMHVIQITTFVLVCWVLIVAYQNNTASKPIKNTLNDSRFYITSKLNGGPTHIFYVDNEKQTLAMLGDMIPFQTVTFIPSTSMGEILIPIKTIEDTVINVQYHPKNDTFTFDNQVLEKTSLEAVLRDAGRLYNQLQEVRAML